MRRAVIGGDAGSLLVSGSIVFSILVKYTSRSITRPCSHFIAFHELQTAWSRLTPTPISKLRYHTKKVFRNRYMPALLQPVLRVPPEEASHNHEDI